MRHPIGLRVMLRRMSQEVCRFSNAGYEDAIHGLMWPAFEKRQGTKSREVREKRCRGRYGDLMLAPGSMAGATPARGDLRVCTQASLGAEHWLSGDAQSAATLCYGTKRRPFVVCFPRITAVGREASVGQGPLQNQPGVKAAAAPRDTEHPP